MSRLLSVLFTVASLTNTCFSAQEGLNGEAPAAEEDAEVSLDLTKKKKKKKKARASELEGLEEPEEGEGAGIVLADAFVPPARTPTATAAARMRACPGTAPTATTATRSCWVCHALQQPLQQANAQPGTV